MFLEGKGFERIILIGNLCVYHVVDGKTIKLGFDICVFKFEFNRTI